MLTFSNILCNARYSINKNSLKKIRFESIRARLLSLKSAAAAATAATASNLDGSRGRVPYQANQPHSDVNWHWMCHTVSMGSHHHHYHQQDHWGWGGVGGWLYDSLQQILSIKTDRDPLPSHSTRAQYQLKSYTLNMC